MAGLLEKLRNTHPQVGGPVYAALTEDETPLPADQEPPDADTSPEPTDDPVPETPDDGAGEVRL